MQTVKRLPALSQFQDRKITTGLKYIMGGSSWTETPGGTSETTGNDYVADAKYGEHTTRGMCSAYKTKEAYFESPAFADWLKMVGL